MTTLAYKRVRLKIEADKWTNALDVLTSATPKMYRGNDCQFEIGLFWNSALIDASNISVISLSIYNTARTTRKATKTVSAVDITANPTTAGWANYTQQHATFIFTGTEMNWALTANIGTEETFFLVVDGITAAGKEITYGVSAFTLVEDGTGVAGSPPANDPNYYTQPEADARFIPALGDGYTFKVVCIGGNSYLAFYTQEDSHWHIAIPKLQDGLMTFTPGPPID